MPHVPAGNITGVYYIVVAGLPWACSWQRLKDFARNQQPDGKCIEIDHAMVYPDSTDGWVRVKGRENFLKAFKHLNGGILDDRSLLADGRNETETQTLRDWTTTYSPTVPYRDRNGSSSSSHTYSSSTASQYSSPSTYSGSDIDWHYQTQPGSQSYASASPTYSFQYYSPQSPIYDGASSPIYTSPVSPYPVAASPSGVVYTSNVVAATPFYIAQQPAYTYALQCMASPYTSSSASPASPPPMVKTEARKIIIRQLPHGTTSSALHELLTKIVSNSKRSLSCSSTPVQSIEIATHVDGKAKGHAFAIFESHAIAKTVMHVVDGMRFQGRVLSARLTKEGAEPAGYGPALGERQPAISSAELSQTFDGAQGQIWGGKGGAGGKGRSGSKLETDGKEVDGEAVVVASSGETKRSGAMSAPAVVDGSSSKGSHGKEKKHRS